MVRTVAHPLDLLLAFRRGPELAPHLRIFLGGQMGEDDPLELALLQGFAGGFVQGDCRPNHLARLQDVSFGVFADGKNLFAFLHDDLGFERRTVGPSSNHVSK
jgi:hypothetical protein